MSGPKAVVITDILEEHVEELEFLWNLRRLAIRSPKYTLRELSDLEDRIDAHLQALLDAGEHGLVFFAQWFEGEESLQAFWGGYGLLRAGDETAAAKVLTVFSQAEGEKRDGLKEALCQGPVERVLPGLRPLLNTAPVPTAAAVAEVLGFHGKLEVKADQMDRFVKHDEAPVRLAGWRAAAGASPRPADTYRLGIQDADPGVRRAAFEAASWGRQAWLADHCRKNAFRAGPDQPDLLLFLGILGKPPDLPRIMTAGPADRSSHWYRALGALGHPGAMGAILDGMKNPDARTAIAAGMAFTKITGFEVESDQPVTLPPEDGHEPDDFEKEFLDEALLPDVELARQHWSQVKDRYKGTRWCRGFDLSKEAPKEVLNQLDLESRWEACLRGAFEGTWHGKPRDLELFPQKR